MLNGIKKGLRMTEKPGVCRYLLIIFICVVISPAYISVSAFGHENQEMPANYITGRWAGEISAELKTFDRKGKLDADGQSAVKILDLSIIDYDEAFEGKAEYSAMNRFYDAQGKIGQRWTLVNNAEIISIYCHIYEDNRIYFSSENEVKVKCDTFLGSNLTEFRAFSIGAFVQILGALLPHGARFEINEGNIFINDEVSIEGFSAKITGVLCRIETLKKNFPEDIKLNEPIMTDKTTRLKITLSGVDKP